MREDMVFKTIKKHFSGMVGERRIRFTPTMLCTQLKNALGYRVDYFEVWGLLRELKGNGEIKQVSKGWYSLTV